MVNLIMSVGTGIKGREDESKDSQGHGIAFAIKNSRPDKIFFLCTKESVDTLKYVEKYLDGENFDVFNNNKNIIELSDMSDINKLIMDISDVFEKIRNEKIIVVPTFGTKMMSSALTILAVLNNAEIFSVEGDRINGIVKKGTERWEGQNYYRIRDNIYLQKVIDYFNKYQYVVAQNYLNNIISDEVKIKGIFYNKSVLKKMIDAYRYWDVFQHQEAFETLKSEYIDDNGVHNNIAFLSQIFNNTNMYENVLVDLINNAYRRIEEGKYDDAVARLYRCFELIAQIRLLKLGLIEEKRLKESKIFTIVTDRLKEVLNEESLKKYISLQREEDLKKGIMKLAMEKSYELLHDLNDDKLGHIYEEFANKKGISILLSKRNSSILAHGLEPISKEIAYDMFETIKAYCKLIIDDLEDRMHKAKFPKLSI